MATLCLSGQRNCLLHVGPAVAAAIWLVLAAMSTSLQADPSDPRPGPPRDREQRWDDREAPPGLGAWRRESPRGPEADGPRRPRGAEDRPMPGGPPRDRERGWDEREPPRGPGAGRREGPPPAREQLERLEAKLDEVLRRLHRLEAELRSRSGAEGEFRPPRFDGREPRPPRNPRGMSDRPWPPTGPHAAPPERHVPRGPETEDRLRRDGPKPRPPHEFEDWDN